MNLVAELVGVTLGPKGRNVVLQNKYGPPKIVNDGETVLKEVLPCPSRCLSSSCVRFESCFVLAIVDSGDDVVLIRLHVWIGSIPRAYWCLQINQGK